MGLTTREWLLARLGAIPISPQTLARDWQTYEELTDLAEATATAAVLTLEAARGDADETFEVCVTHLGRGVRALRLAHEERQGSSFLGGVPLYAVRDELALATPVTARARRQHAALREVGARAAARLDIASDVLGLGRQILDLESIKGRLDAIANAEAARLDAMAAAAERERQQRRVEERRREERIEQARLEARKRAETISREARRRGYWINRDGTVDLADSIDRPEDYRPQFDDVQGDYWGGMGLPGPADTGIPDPRDDFFS